MRIYIVILTNVHPMSKDVDILYCGFSLSAANLTVKGYSPDPEAKGYIHIHTWKDEEETSISLERQF
jgi:hypothetical protein